MKRSLAVCLAIAGIALAAFTAASASAAPGEWDWACKSPTDGCFLVGQQLVQNQLTVNGGILTCTTMNFTGTATGGTTVKTSPSSELDWTWHSLTLHPEISGCKAFGQNITVTTTGCNYVITASSSTKGTFTIECEAGKSIIAKGNTTGCTVTFSAQAPFNNDLDFASEGTPKDLKITETIGTEPLEAGKNTGITYVSSGGACGESANNATLRGSIRVKGYREEAHKEQVPFTPVETIAGEQIKG